MLPILLAATCLALPAHDRVIDVRPLNPHTFYVNEAFSRASYAYDGTYEYIGTAQGLYRTLSIASDDPSTFDLLLSGRVNQVTVHQDALYALMEGGENAGAALDHTVLRSTDAGKTFTPLDAGLQECNNGICRFLAATQIDFAPDRIFLAAGGNLLVSTDAGATWTLLFGTPASGAPATQTCPMVFGRNDTRVVIGGECPLDQGFVSVGTLRSNLMEWADAPRRLTSPLEIPPLENRNALFVSSVGDQTFVGVEGGVLESCDGAATFDYAIRFPIDGPRYPYPHQFLAPVKHPNVRIIAGFDKATFGPYLAWSADGGATWMDASALLPPDSSVALLTERRDGLPMIFIQRGTTLSMSQLVISELPLRRRSVSH